MAEDDVPRLGHRVVGILDSRGLAGRRRDTGSWHGTAFLIESVVLLAFIAFSMATVSSLLADAHRVGRQANELSGALALATTGARNGAETFAACPDDPDAPAVTYYRLEDGSFVEVGSYGPDTYVVRRVVQEQRLEGGTLYRASINVEMDNRTVYTLPTARYVSGNRTDDRVGIEGGIDLEHAISDLGLVPVVVSPDLTDPVETLMVMPTVNLNELHVMERKEPADEGPAAGVVVSSEKPGGLHPAVRPGGE